MRDAQWEDERERVAAKVRECANALDDSAILPATLASVNSTLDEAGWDLADLCDTDPEAA